VAPENGSHSSTPQVPPLDDALWAELGSLVKLIDSISTDNNSIASSTFIISSSTAKHPHSWRR
jgi:hypothetical protein